MHVLVVVGGGGGGGRTNTPMYTEGRKEVERERGIETEDEGGKRGKNTKMVDKPQRV